MPTRTTRSGRAVKNSSSDQRKLDALELLQRQRAGEKVEGLVKDDEPLYEEVDEEEHRRTRSKHFVVDPESDELDSDDADFIDNYDGFGDEDEGSKPKKGHGSRKRVKEAEIDPRQRSMKSFLGASQSKSKSTSRNPVIEPSKQPEVNQDDVLKAMLFDVPVNRASSAQKPIRSIPRLTTAKTSTMSQISRPVKKRASYDPAPVKRVRMSSDPEVLDSSVVDDMAACEFDDSWPAPEIPASSKSFDTSANDVVMDDEPELDEQNDVGVAAAPLNEDLKSNLEFHDYKDGQKFTRLYWYDCCEDQAKSPGVVYLFGRIYAVTTKRYVSCCTIVKNIKRTCYLLINQDSTYDQAVGEFTHIIAKRFKIKNFTCEKVTKKYAFASDPGVPYLADYVQVDYPATQNALPSNLKGETFSYVFNTNQSPMEKIILGLKLRGPCWLKLIEPAASPSQLTWTKIELVLESPDNLLVEENCSGLKDPYFCCFSLALRTYPNPVTHHNEIIAIAGMVNTSFNLDQCLKRTNKASGHFCLMTKPAPGHKELKLPYDFTTKMKNFTRTRFELLETERDLLAAFIDKFTNLDPDIVVGHDVMNFDFETLVARMQVTKLGLWSKLGRFNRKDPPSTKAAFRYAFSGRVICDIRMSAMELMPARSYDLTELTSRVLNTTRVDFDHAAIVECFKSSEGLIKLLNATWIDNDNIFSILVELNVVPLALKITNITGNILSRTLAAGRSERNEYLLLHAFHEENFICPEKRVSAKNYKKHGEEPANTPHGRKKAAYAGGLVLEPKVGYYDNCVLLMDFNSLYPSIIQEFNICFSTIKAPEQAEDENAAILATVPDDSVSTGVLPTQLKNLVDRRRQVKRLIAEAKSDDQKLLLDIEQKALKLTANSMYGCLGFEQSRFYAKHLASLVTFKGREILMSTKAMVEKLGFEVIYGDTDSLMIHTKITDYDTVIQQGTEIKIEINKTFKLLEIDIDGVYKPLLLLKKKNYAGTSLKKLPDGTIEESIETKGLDTVRRDRAVVAKEAGKKVLEMILTGKREISQTVEDIHNYLKELGDQIRSDLVPKEQFLISKQLNRNPEEYQDTKGIGHVTLALRHNKDPHTTRKLKSGDTVEYVVCADNSNESANQRAYTLAEMAQRPDELKLDYEYYLCQQIHPIMTRICDKLPITNAYVLAEMLGVEKSNMLQIKNVNESDNSKRDQLTSRGEARFNTCKPLVVACPNCNLPTEISSRTRKNTDKRQELSLSSCPHCNVRYASYSKQVVVQVIALIRKLTAELYNSRFSCENPECDYQTRNVFCPLTSEDQSSAAMLKAQPVCRLCGSSMIAEMDDRKMDLQLNFVKHLFDVDKERRDNEDQLNDIKEDTLEMYRCCFREVDYALRCSFINNIDAFSLFSMICSGRSDEPKALLAIED